MTPLRLVGILGDTLGDPYSLRIIEGAFQRLSRLGFNSAGIAGGFPSAPMFQDAEGGAVFPAAFDGIVLLSEILDNTGRRLEEAVEHSNATVVSIGVEMARAASVRVNDEVGVLQAVAHLVKLHDCKRIAFIAGPERSLDSQRRAGAYRAALGDFGLTYDPMLVVRGDYEARSGYEAVRTLRQRNTRGGYDAILAANDLMAIGAIDALRSASVPVPERVKVVGFDDTAEAAFVVPALTTIKQPIFEQGMASADLIAKLLAREALQDRTLTSTALVIRQSCGCSDLEARRKVKPLADGEDRWLIDDAFRRMIRRQLAARRVHGELARLGSAIVGASAFEELAAAMSRVFRLLGPKRFLLCMYAGNRRQARVVLESSGRDVVFRPESESFLVGRLFPSGFLKGTTPTQLLIEPLCVAEEHFGYSVIEASDLDPHAHLELRYMLGSALARIVTARELRRLYLLEKNFTELKRQRDELAAQPNAPPSRE